MEEPELKDLTRKAMIREYFLLKQNTISILDAANEIYSFIEQHYEYDEELQEKLDAYDELVDNLDL